AARAKTNITICASAAPMSAGADCDGASFDGGWIIFIDENGNVQRDAAEDNVLRRHPPVHETVNIRTKPASTYFSFAATGHGRGDVGVGDAFETAMICDERGQGIAAGGSSAARRIVVTPLGRSVVIRDAALMPAGACP